MTNPASGERECYRTTATPAEVQQYILDVFLCGQLLVSDLLCCRGWKDRRIPKIIQPLQFSVPRCRSVRTQIARAEKLAQVAGISATTVTTACRHEKIQGVKAERIAAALEMPVGKLFELERDTTPLSAKSLLAYHRLIHTILHEAEREMLVAYNAASRAAPPKDIQKAPNYFQPEQISEILKAWRPSRSSGGLLLSC